MKQHIYAAVLIAAGMIVNNAAFAQPVADCGSPNPLSASTDFGSLAGYGADGCIQQDKIYRSFDGTLPASQPVTIATLLDIPIVGEDTHTVTIGAISNPAGSGAPLVYTFSYSIEIDPSLIDFASRFIKEVTIGADVPAGTTGVSVVKNVSDAGGGLLATLTSIDGTQDSISGLHESKLLISETITVNPGAALFSSTDTYLQQVAPLPEPASASLFGLGLAAMSFSRRRKLPASA